MFPKPEPQGRHRYVEGLIADTLRGFVLNGMYKLPVFLTDDAKRVVSAFCENRMFFPRLAHALCQKYGERREADRVAVRDDASGEWVRSMGGTDRRDKPGPLDAGGGRDG